ncbi:MAG: ribulose-phosphate 3-epimerase [Flavobacteriales bacterium]|nr:ribulose-phosphate 3-epimerase [Flavobacteriales bacterium]|tara:strand:+ start:1913 stop:2563 length:651 start_codon:yes stop_codon:yes gene_type:complete
MNHLIAPSMLASDFGNLKSEINMVNNSDADWFHLDIMDGVFVPNISYGMPIVKTIKKYAQKPLDVHLMIKKPERYIEVFAQHGADILTVHFEACNHLHRTIDAIKMAGMQAGVAINPHTNPMVLSDILIDIDVVCVMSVNPGFGGQSFIQNTYKKIEFLKNLKKDSGSKYLIEVDGGVNLENYEKLINCGANILVAGSSVFNTKDPIQTIKKLKEF